MATLDDLVKMIIFLTVVQADMNRKLINMAPVSSAFSWPDAITWTACLGANFLYAWTMSQNGIVCVTGILFAYRTPKIFESSPCSKYKIAGIPLTVVTGSLGLLWCAVMAYYYLSIAGLRAQVPASYCAIVGFFILAFAIYYISKAYRKRQGIDIGLAFREIPPL